MSIEIPTAAIIAGACIAVAIGIRILAGVLLSKYRANKEQSEHNQKAKLDRLKEQSEHEWEAKIDRLLPNWRQVYNRMKECGLCDNARVVLMKYCAERDEEGLSWKGQLSPQALELLCEEMGADDNERARRFEEFAVLLK